MKLLELLNARRAEAARSASDVYREAVNALAEGRDTDDADAAAELDQAMRELGIRVAEFEADVAFTKSINEHRANITSHVQVEALRRESEVQYRALQAVEARHKIELAEANGKRLNASGALMRAEQINRHSLEEIRRATGEHIRLGNRLRLQLPD